MIDHLIVTQQAPDLNPLGIEAWDGVNPSAGWFNGHRVDVLRVSVIRTEGTDETPPEFAPGVWFCVRSDVRLDLPWPFVTITDSELALMEDEPFVLAIGEGWDWSQLTGRVWPIWSGTAYPFGPDMGPHLLINHEV